MTVGPLVFRLNILSVVGILLLAWFRDHSLMATDLGRRNMFGNIGMWEVLILLFIVMLSFGATTPRDRWLAGQRDPRIQG